MSSMAFCNNRNSKQEIHLSYENWIKNIKTVIHFDLLKRKQKNTGDIFPRKKRGEGGGGDF